MLDEDASGTLTELIWETAATLRGHLSVDQSRDAIWSLVVLRRLECFHLPTPSGGLQGVLKRNEDTGQDGSENELADDLIRFAGDMRVDVADVLNGFGFAGIVRNLAALRMLRCVVSAAAALDLDAEPFSDQQMTNIDPALAELLSDRYLPGQGLTPRDVAMLTATLLLGPDEPRLAGAQAPIRVHDPCCGVGGAFAAVDDVLRALGCSAPLVVAGQEFNPSAQATAKAMQLLRGADPAAIAAGDVLIDDRYHGQKFDYVVAAPPFGHGWYQQRDTVSTEARELGFSGRFGAGLPTVSDSSFLFVQHVVAHLRAAHDGEARAAILLSASALSRGGAGSGESNIRRWLVEQDLLEAIVALPANLWPHTGIRTYLWLLTNRKPPRLAGKVIAIDARARYAEARRSPNGRRAYFTNEHIARIAEQYEAARNGTLAMDKTTHKVGPATLLDAADLGYRELTIEQPLRCHFAVSQEALDTIESSKTMTRFARSSDLSAALHTLAGETWTTWAACANALSEELRKTSLPPVELNRSIRQLIRTALTVPDPSGEIQRDEGNQVLPDQTLRFRMRIPLHQDADAYLRREISPEHPGAWINHNATQIVYVLPNAPFLVSGPRTGFEPLSAVARQLPSYSLAETALAGRTVLHGRDLQTVDRAVELPSATGTRQPMTACTGGDVVGNFGNWRLLPPDFGEALTPLMVLRPLGTTSGRALCEWLRTKTGEEGAVIARLTRNSLVPATLIRDTEFDSYLHDVELGRDALAETTAKILPNLFHEPSADPDAMKHAARSAASEARLVEELVQPLTDPLWRAEWSYPYQVAALARRYRVATTLAERKDALLKLGESIARCLGVLSLAIQIRRGGRFSRTLRDQFSRGGATFGTWTTLIRNLVKEGPVPEFPELDRASEAGGALDPLTILLDLRNDSGHAHGVKAEYALEREVNELRPLAVAALQSVGWLSGVHWDLVTICEYTTQGPVVSGRRLRGSHRDWESFERPCAAPLTPNRIYVDITSSSAPLDLWPVATAEHCLGCDAVELFLLTKIAGRVLTLRCGRDHEIQLPLNDWSDTVR